MTNLDLGRNSIALTRVPFPTSRFVHSFSDRAKLLLYCIRGKAIAQKQRPSRVEAGDAATEDLLDR